MYIFKTLLYAEKILIILTWILMHFVRITEYRIGAMRQIRTQDYDLCTARRPTNNWRWWWSHASCSAGYYSTEYSGLMVLIVRLTRAWLKGGCLNTSSIAVRVPYLDIYLIIGYGNSVTDFLVDPCRIFFFINYRASTR